MSPLALGLRPASPGDREFLLRVYAEKREEELALLPWTRERKLDFLAQQFDAQDVSYRLAHPDGHSLVISNNGEPIGRLYRSFVRPGELRIIDIALLREWRNRGIGTQLIRAILVEADHCGAVVSLHVERWSRARPLYERLGFREAGSDDVYTRMERPIS